MINIDFSYAITFYICLCLCVILFLWVFRGKVKDKDLFLDPKFIWFCSICTYTYINTKEFNITTCPRCGSYNKK
ncbi:MAG: hypothetical protein ABSE81_05280 [Candidatus Omnitrophota bacterium]